MVPQSRNLVLTLATAGVNIRTETYQGREHVVVPVVALVEGIVHAMNASNPELVTAEEFSRAPIGWNGRPIFYGHPLVKGRPVSGNTPEVLESKSVGIVFNTLVKDSKLTMEAWIDKEKADAVDPTLLVRVLAGDPIEISVGAFVETDDSKGEFKGKKYLGAWHDIVPDHLALLPVGEEGACSRKMGCGVRAAKEHSMDHMYTAWLEAGPETCELLKTLRNIPQSERDKMDAKDFAGPDQSFPIAKPEDVAAAAHSLGRAKGDREAIKAKIISIAYRKGADFVAKLPDDWKKKKDQKNASVFSKFLSMFRAAQPAGDMSNNDLTRKLYDALREVTPTLTNIEAYLPVNDPNRVVYSCWEQVPSMSEMGMGYTGYCMYERAFTLDASGLLTLGPDVVEVEAVLSYLPVLMAEEPTVAVGKRNSAKDQEQIQQMHDHAVALGAYCDPKMAQKNASCGCKAHEAKINSQGEADMKSKEEIVKFLETATSEQITALSAAIEPKAEVVVVAAETKTPTFEEILATAAPAVRDSITEGMRVASDRKAATIKALKDTGRCDMSDEQLGAKTQAELDTLVKLAGSNVRAAIDFGVNAPKDLQGAKPETEVAAPSNLYDAIRAAKK